MLLRSCAEASCDSSQAKNPPLPALRATLSRKGRGKASMRLLPCTILLFRWTFLYSFRAFLMRELDIALDLHQSACKTQCSSPVALKAHVLGLELP
jgi:hypothetical protein